MEMIDIHLKFHIKEGFCYFRSTLGASSCFHILKIRFMDISIRFYAMCLTCQFLNLYYLLQKGRASLIHNSKRLILAPPVLAFQEGEHGLDEHKLHMYLSALQSLIPPLFALVLQNAPFSSKAKLHGEVPQIEGTEFKLLKGDVEY